MHKAFCSHIILITLFSNLFARQFIPANCAYLNHYEAVFIGRMLDQEKIGDRYLILFDVEEAFKYRLPGCEIMLWSSMKALHLCETQGKDAQWLVYAWKEGDALFFSMNPPGGSTSLGQSMSYSKGLLQEELAYLRDYAQNPNRSINEAYRLTETGCTTDYAIRFVEGELKDGFPDGRWTYYDHNGRIEQEGIYENGEKEGIWRSYHPNRMLAEKIKFRHGTEIQRLMYDNDGILWCINDSCHATFLHPPIWDYSDSPLIEEKEERGFIRDKIRRHKLRLPENVWDHSLIYIQHRMNVGEILRLDSALTEEWTNPHTCKTRRWQWRHKMDSLTLLNYWERSSMEQFLQGETIQAESIPIIFIGESSFHFVSPDILIMQDPYKSWPTDELKKLIKIKAKKRLSLFKPISYRFEWEIPDSIDHMALQLQAPEEIKKLKTVLAHEQFSP
ncbi:MAG: hypothetical protein AAF206_06425 [Bacteroidota bacterium]